MTFHHGIESQDIESFGFAQENSVSVVGIVGTAPITAVGVDYKTVNQIVSINSLSQGIQYFGNKTENFTIPEALDTLFSVPNPPLVLVINVYDPDTHTTGVSAVSDADVIGTTNVDTGVKTGLLKFHDAQSEMNIKPRFIHIPKFNESASVVTAIKNICEKLRARTIIDCPTGKTVSQAIAKRNTENDAFNNSSTRIKGCYPYIKKADASKEAGYALRALSTELLAEWCNTIAEKGYHYSPSNKSAVLRNVVGLEAPITFDVKDINCDANLLNAQGITTVASGFGLGYRAWGNRNISFPTNTNLLSFDCVQLVDDVISDAIEANALQYMDLPLSNALIQEILDSGNLFLRSKKAEGKIHDGEMFYEPDRNKDLPPGQLVISRRIAPVLPLELLKFVNKLEYYTTTQTIQLASY